MKLKAVVTNVCGAAGNLIYPPIIAPGETSRWTRVFFLRLLVFRRDALIKVNAYREELVFPILITADTLSGVQKAYFEACEYFSSNGCFIAKQMTKFSKDMFFLVWFFLNKV